MGKKAPSLRGHYIYDCDCRNCMADRDSIERRKRTIQECQSSTSYTLQRQYRQEREKQEIEVFLRQMRGQKI